MKALLLHVGIDSTNLGVSAPVFTDQTFEYIPIAESIAQTKKYLMKRPDGRLFVRDFREQQESDEYPWLHDSVARTYSEIHVNHSTSGKGHGVFLKDYIPARFGYAVVHYDPDFDHSTYADRVDDSRGQRLELLDPEDYLVFVASLAPYVKEAYDAERTKGQIARFQKYKMAKYLIGYLKVREVYCVTFDTERFKTEFSDASAIVNLEKNEDVTEQIDASVKEQISMNAHSNRNTDQYYIAVGLKKESRRLTHALRITEAGSPFRPNERGKQIFEKAFPRGWKWVCGEPQLGNLLEALDASSIT